MFHKRGAPPSPILKTGKPTGEGSVFAKVTLQGWQHSSDERCILQAGFLSYPCLLCDIKQVSGEDDTRKFLLARKSHLPPHFLDFVKAPRPHSPLPFFNLTKIFIYKKKPNINCHNSNKPNFGLKNKTIKTKSGQKAGSLVLPCSRESLLLWVSSLVRISSALLASRHPLGHLRWSLASTKRAHVGAGTKKRVVCAAVSVHLLKSPVHWRTLGCLRSYADIAGRRTMTGVEKTSATKSMP